MVRELPVAPIVPGLATLPVNVLLALGEDATRGDRRSIFNLPAAAGALLGDWSRIRTVLNLRIWAPEWDADRFRSYLGEAGRKASSGDLPDDTLRASSFLGLPDVDGGEPDETASYEIVHCIGQIGQYSNGDPYLSLGFGRHRSLAPGTLRDALVRCGTRLLILHSLGLYHYTGDSSERLAEFIAGAGGPAVLVVADDGAHEVDAYLRNLYGRILRNQPIAEATVVSERGPSTLLVHGMGGDRLLQFDGLMERLGKQLGAYSALVKKLLDGIRDIQRGRLQVTHAPTSDELRSLAELDSRIDTELARLAHARTSVGAHAAEGASHLSAVVANVASITEDIGLTRGEGPLHTKFDLLEYSLGVAQRGQWDVRPERPDDATDRETRSSSQEQKPRWILANVFDLSAADRKKPTPAFRAGGAHEIRVIIGAEREDWLVARGRDASESIDNMLPTGTHELTVVFFIPALGIHQTGKLTLPPNGPSPKPAMFRFEVGAAGSAIEALISIVHRGRVLQTTLLSGKAVANPLRAPKAARIALRLQVVVPGFADLDRREVFDAALVTATGATDAAVAAGVVHSAAGSGRTVLFDQPRIDGAARAIRTALEEVVTDDSTKGKLDAEAARTLLWKLAQEGRILYEHIGERLEKELSGSDLSRLQLVQVDPDAFIPIEFAYELPPPANGAGLCKNWKRALAGELCTAEHHRTNALGHLEVVCPSGFWSMSKVIERQILEGLTSEEMSKSDFGVRAEPSAERPSLPPIGSALFAWSDILDNTVPGTSAGILKSLNEATREHGAAVKTWLAWAKAIEENQPGLLVLLSHTVDDALEIGPENSGEKATLAQINSKFVKRLAQDAPIVFLLGCTTGVADDKLVSFVGRFRDQGAALVVGTITPVLGERSAAVVEAVVAKLAQKRAQPARFGELMRDARRDLLSRGELTALCVTSFGDASWLVS